MTAAFAFVMRKRPEAAKALATLLIWPVLMALDNLLLSKSLSNITPDIHGVILHQSCFRAFEWAFLVVLQCINSSV